MRLFPLLRTLKVSTVIVVDNVDQHDYNFQERLFIFSSHISRELEALTILAVREETFLNSTRVGVLDAYDIPKFHIASPNFLNLIKRRIDFTMKLLRSELVVERLRIPDEKTQKELLHFFQIIERSLMKDNAQSQRIVRFFDNISVGNMRQALEMFNGFLVSGNTNVNEMFEKEQRSERSSDIYQISFHQLMKSIMLGEYRFYCSERSHIANVFDFDYSIGDSHFNQLRLLSILKEKENTKSEIGRGYYGIDDLVQDMQRIAVSKEVVIDSLRRLVLFNLIALDNQSRVDVLTASYARITPAGDLFLNELVSLFGYLDGVCVDTPIAASDLYYEIRRLSTSNDLPTRLKRTRLFVEYLLESERNEYQNNPSLSGESSSSHNFADTIRRSFNDFVERMAARGVIENADQYHIESA